VAVISTSPAVSLLIYFGIIVILEWSKAFELLLPRRLKFKLILLPLN
jgi:hypothetical protein